MLPHASNNTVGDGLCAVPFPLRPNKKSGRLHAAPIHKFTFSCIEYTRICS